jgi:hypothetical protein
MRIIAVFLSAVEGPRYNKNIIASRRADQPPGSMPGR